MNKDQILLGWNAVGRERPGKARITPKAQLWCWGRAAALLWSRSPAQDQHLGFPCGIWGGGGEANHGMGGMGEELSKESSRMSTGMMGQLCRHSWGCSPGQEELWGDTTVTFLRELQERWRGDLQGMEGQDTGNGFTLPGRRFRWESKF